MNDYVPLTKDEERRRIILTSAFEIFATYGFKRTSMDDIAKTAGMSRPALYQSFANKNDIFRALARDSLEKMAEALRLELEKKLPIENLLDNLFEISVLAPHKMMEAMPHGEEIFGLKESVAPDIFLEWMERSREAYEKALLQKPGIDPGLAEALAKMISDAITGMKSRHEGAIKLELGFSAIKRVVEASWN